jgi:polysaccharide biosynthesis/export protein
MMTSGMVAACGATLNNNGQFAATPDQLSATPSATSALPSPPNPTTAAATGSTSKPANTTVTGSIAASSNSKAEDVLKSPDALKIIAVSDPSSSAYKIGPLDVLEISVFKVPDLSRTVQVADSGTINLPLVGEVPAAGRTAQDVERDLTKRLGAKYLQNPQVNIYVKEYNSQRVTVEGSVKKPGVYPIRGGTTLLQLVATAEGFTDTAQSEVAVFRNVDGKRTAAKFDVGEIRTGNAKDPQLVQGDVVVVSDSMVKSAYQGLLKALPLAAVAPLL